MQGHNHKIMIWEGLLMIIEFIGIPGSGKTHISYLLYDYLNEKEYEVQHCNHLSREDKSRRMSKLLMLLPYTFNIYFLLMIYKILTNKSSISGKKILLFIFLQRILVYRKIFDKKKGKQKIYILDEGFLHFAIAFHRQNKETSEERNLNTYLELLSKIIPYDKIEKTFVFVECDIDESYKRIESRKYGWPGKVGNGTNKEKNKYLEDNYRNYSLIKNNKSIITQSVFIDNCASLIDSSLYFNEVFVEIENKIN